MFKNNSYDLEATIEQLTALVAAEERMNTTKEDEDEKIAIDLAMKIEKREAQKRRKQEKRDADLARKLMEEADAADGEKDADESGASPPQPHISAGPSARRRQ